MKKLMMFAAAMTIVGGAYAQCGEPLPVGECALVYDIKISLKTTKANEGSAQQIPCGEEIGALCYRTVSSVTWKGFLSACGCDCVSFQDADVYIWNDKTEEYITDVLGAKIDWQVLNLIGKKGTDVEAFWVAGGNDTGATIEEMPAILVAAGFGKWDADEYRVSSISGNIVAKLPPPQCAGVLCADATAEPCSELDQDNQTYYTVGSGTWSMKYNKKASQKSADTGDLPWPKWSILD